jgi:parallel beta-helix repeat protein
MMSRKGAVIWLSFVLVFSFIVIIVKIAPVVEAPTIWYVDDVAGSGGPGDPPEDFTSIQDAINASIDGDTVFVYNGTYYEPVKVNKTISLTGEDRTTTIIDGGGNGNVVNITADLVNITGFTVVGGGTGLRESAGIELYNVQNCEVSNNTVSNNVWSGIYLYYSDRNTIIGNNVSNNDEGIYLWYSSNDTIANNNVSDNTEGINLRFSSNNNITGNEVSNNTHYGLVLFSSSSISITANNFVYDGIFVEEDRLHPNNSRLSHYNSHNIPTNNIVSGKPMYYYKDSSSITIDAIPMGQLILANCTNIIVRNLQINNTDVGIEVAYSMNTNITSNTLSLNDHGVYLLYSSNNDIATNNVLGNRLYGIYLLWSSDNKIADNNILYCRDEGIMLVSSSNNAIIGNNVSHNLYGISLKDSFNNNLITDNIVSLNGVWGIWFDHSNGNYIIGNNVSNNRDGIYIFSSSNNTVTRNSFCSNTERGLRLGWESNNNLITDNNISNNPDGIYLYRSDWNNILGNNVSNNNDGIYLELSSDNNMIIGNIAFKNGYGIPLVGSSNNSIYNNNIIDNTFQAYDDRSDNSWDNGYPSGGNYWSDFDEPGEGAYDYFKGQDQNVIGRDGIVDNGLVAGGGKNPYIIDSDSQDNYPLIGPSPYFPTENYTLLKQGWNLISIPLIQNDQNLTKVLEPIKGYYDAVQWYDITDTNDPWKHYKVGKPYRNDLNKLNESMGFWIYITQPRDTIFFYNGTLPTINQTISLYPGWNLVGYPSIRSYNRTHGLNNLTYGTHIDSIWTYYAATQKWKEMGSTDYFELGRGYWVHAKTTCQWEVPL